MIKPTICILLMTLLIVLIRVASTIRLMASHSAVWPTSYFIYSEISGRRNAQACHNNEQPLRYRKLYQYQRDCYIHLSQKY